MMRIDCLVTPVAIGAADRPAVQESRSSMTYGELDALANRFANFFRSLGVRPGDRVGVHVPRSGITIAAFLGAARVGAVFVPLDPSSPPARMKIIAADCGLRHVVITPALLTGWLSAGILMEHFVVTTDEPVPIVPESSRLHAWSDVLGAKPDPVAPISTSPDDLAYLLYTSGSTGVPKGVMISHRNALAFVEWAAATAEVRADDRVASVAPFHFDLSVFDIWATLSRGATLVIVDEKAVLSGRLMIERIAEQRITVWYSVPSALILMLESGDLAGRCRTLRVVFFAGEVFPIRHLRRLMRALPRARFFNLFGPTETNVCLAHEVVTVPDEDTTAIPIGRPACGDTVSILDDTHTPVPDGTLGELWVDGPTVMLGYWNGGKPLPAPHPYPTGDFVARRPDGEIMYHGRRDHMVKVHGFRIELGEVEAALTRHPGIIEAVAFATDGRLAAVIQTDDTNLSVLDVRRHCALRLPPYMIPSEIRLVGRLPRTASGKVDRVQIRNTLASGERASYAHLPSAASSPRSP
jgi:amino acid adenylation domain-containing protein